MVFRLHFKCHFWQDFLNFRGHFGVHLAPFCRKKNCSENGFEKRGPIHENKSLWTCPEAPREAASRAHFSNKKQQFQHKFQTLLLELKSCARKCCFNWFALQCFQKCSKKWKDSMSKTHYWLSDTPNRPKAWRILVRQWCLLKLMNALLSLISLFKFLWQC